MNTITASGNYSLNPQQSVLSTSCLSSLILIYWFQNVQAVHCKQLYSNKYSQLENQVQKILAF